MADAPIIVADTSMPEWLLLDCDDAPSFRGQANGKYHLVPGRIHNGVPVWKHEKYAYLIHGTRDGHWMVSVGDRSMKQDGGHFRSFNLHAGKGPHEMVSEAQDGQGRARPWDDIRPSAWRTRSMQDHSSTCHWYRSPVQIRIDPDYWEAHFALDKVKLITIHFAQPDDDADGMLQLVLTNLGGDELAELQVDPSSLAKPLVECMQSDLGPWNYSFILPDASVLQPPLPAQLVRDWLGLSL